MRRHHILIPLAALLAISPLVLNGCSCGHDFDFHLQSWLDAASQLRHGSYPHWIFSAAWNAGEPRFIFYPPLSWLLGALLTMLFPIAATPAIYTFLGLTAAGFTMHRLASHFAPSNAALLASILYLANPYMLFNAFERTAYAELLAAAWIPLLFLAVLRRKPTIPGIAISIALLWLTNAPAAVMGCYTFALLATLRLGLGIFSSPFHSDPELAEGEEPASRAQRVRSSLPLALTYILGTTLGLTLSAFYLIPAAYQRRFVQIAMAIIPNMRIQDNFLFTRTADEPHNAVLHTASVLAVTLVIFTIIATTTLYFRNRKPLAPLLETQDSKLETVSQTRSPSNLQTPLLILTLLIAFLLIPISTPIWNHLPNLAFLQFPWRLLTILSAALALTIALLLGEQPGAPFITQFHRVMSGKPLQLAAPLCALALSLIAIHLYRQPCDIADSPNTIAQLFLTHHGVPATDEYTPNHANSDYLRTNDPAYWLADNPAAFAPNTLPNPILADPNFDDDIPPQNTISEHAPSRITIHADKPEYLILNLRNYPNWQIAMGCETCIFFNVLQHVPRDDGLIAIAVPQGTDTVNIAWHTTPDQHLGLAISLLACLVFAFLIHRSRKITT